MWLLLDEIECKDLSGLDADAIVALTQHQLPKLLSLSLSGNSYLQSSAFAHLDNSSWPQLCSLDLSHTLVDIASMSGLRQALWPLLSNLDLRATGFKTAADIGLLAQASLPRLRTLDLSCNSLDAAAMPQLAEGFWPGLYTCG